MITHLELLYTLCGLQLISLTLALCGASIKWSHNVNIEHVYGMWYGVGYAKHTPDMTDKPEDIGCVTLYITDADEYHDDRLDWTLPQKNNTYRDWLSRKNNPWSETSLSGSWLDARIRLRRQEKEEMDSRYKRDMNGKRRLKVIWDEDGQSMEQTYVYTKDVPGLWTVEKWRPMEREMMSHGVDIWYPDDPPRHPEVIRVLKASTDQLIINHCADVGGGGIFSLILRRSPGQVGYWEWFDVQKQLSAFDLPYAHRKEAVCAACSCSPMLSGICSVCILFVFFWKLL